MSAAEHAAKYSALAATLGHDALRAILAERGIGPERVRAALAAGDEHLNTLPLALWDRAALGDVAASRRGECPCCKRALPNPVHSADWPYSALRDSARFAPWRNAPTLSLAERVCVLKWAAENLLA